MSPETPKPSEPSGETPIPETEAEDEAPSSETEEGVPTPEIANEGPIVLFDGVCNLCNGLVRFAIPRDPEGTFRFAPLQSAAGRELLERTGLPTDALETFVLIEGDTHYTKSAAALRAAEHFGWPYALVSPLRFVPKPVRDAVYDLVADRRYRWFGRREECMVPSPEVESRFLDGAGSVAGDGRDEPP